MSTLALVVLVVLVVVIATGASAYWRARREKTDRRPPYLVALGALADGDEELALASLKAAVRGDSSNVDAYLRLADLFRRRGEAGRALQIRRELASRTGLPKPLRARIHESLAQDLLSLDRLEKAAEAAEEAVRLADDSPSALTTLLETRERMEDLDAAYKIKREILKTEGGGRADFEELAAYRAEQAGKLLESGDAKRAEKLLREALKLDPDCHRARLLQGNLEESRGNYAEAIRFWERLLDAEPQEAEEVFRSLERAHFLAGTFSQMELTYERFLSENPEHEAASFGLASFLRRKGQFDEAYEICRSALETNSESVPLRVLSLALLLQAGRIGEAESQADDWVARHLSEEPVLETDEPSAADENPLFETSQ
jgi:lipopolysaccharide biosynthesis regulator YciM